MGSEKEVSNSDTLERSNLSSLQSDNNSLKKSSELNKCVFHQHTCGNTKFCQIPCPILNFDPTHYSNTCFCEYHLKENDPQKQNDNETTKHKKQSFNMKWPRPHGVTKNDKKCEGKKCRKKSFGYEKVLEGIHPEYSGGTKNLESSEKNNSNKKIELGKDAAEKIEIYYFDHGNSGYYHTTDSPPILTTEKFAEKANKKVTKIFAEMFGCLHCITSIFTTFFLQCLRFMLFSLVRPLTVGVIQLAADYFLKPLLSITFNGLIQPFFILFYNMATSFRDCCEPLATTVGFYIREVAVLLGSFRLIEITHNYKSNSNT